jgi:hypothetical protein
VEYALENDLTSFGKGFTVLEKARAQLAAQSTAQSLPARWLNGRRRAGVILSAHNVLLMRVSASPLQAARRSRGAWTGRQGTIVGQQINRF